MKGLKESEIRRMAEEMARNPRGIYCHRKGCMEKAAFVLLPGNELLCEGCEPHAFFPPGTVHIPKNYWSWKDKEEWHRLDVVYTFAKFAEGDIVTKEILDLRYDMMMECTWGRPVGPYWEQEA